MLVRSCETLGLMKTGDMELFVDMLQISKVIEQNGAGECMIVNCVTLLVGGCLLRVQGLVGTGLVDSPDGGR